MNVAAQAMIATLKNTLMVRPLCIKELPLCVPHGEAFHREMQLPDTFASALFLENWTTFLSAYDAVILGLWQGEELIGGLGAMIAPNLNTGVLVATELFWFIAAAHRGGTGGLRLLRAYLAWARAHGAVRCQLAHFLDSLESPRDGQFARLFTKMGGRPLEMFWEFPLYQ